MVWIPTALVVAVLMDAWAGLLHGKVWHAALWPVHRSHHQRRRGRLEANDLLSGLHAPVAIALILWGCVSPPGLAGQLAFGAGIGMTAFGVAYLLVHDGLVHGRLPVQRLARLPFLARVREAHEIHHREARGGAPYSLFLGPWELSRAARRGRQAESPHGHP